MIEPCSWKLMITSIKRLLPGERDGLILTHALRVQLRTWTRNPPFAQDLFGGGFRFQFDEDDAHDIMLKNLYSALQGRVR